MDLIDQLKELSIRVRKIKDTVQTEEATKNALIMPFIQILGYNVFDPNEVTPELVADVGMKKGEKVDYAILKDGKPIMLFECKKSGSDLKYTRAIRNVLADWMVAPSEDFVRLACSEVINGKRITPAIKEQFTLITKNAFQQLISDKINERLKLAMEPSEELKKDNIISDQDSDGIITTEEEFEGYRIVRAILRETVDPKRVVMRDSKSYCAILLDDNNRKPICRLRFNNPSRMMLGLFEEKEERIVSVTDLSDIYQHADHFKKTVLRYNKPAELLFEEGVATERS